MKLRNALMAVASVTLASHAAAEEPGRSPLASVLTEGGRVRLRSTAVEGRPFGRVVALDESALTLATEEGQRLKIPLASIVALDASLGRKRNGLRGLAIGAAVGALLSLSFEVDPNDCGEDAPNFCSRRDATAAGTLVFGGLGAGVGALIKNERWGRVSLNPPESRVSYLRPRFAVAIGVRF